MRISIDFVILLISWCSKIKIDGTKLARYARKRNKNGIFKKTYPPPSRNVDSNLIKFIMKSLFTGPWTNHLDKIFVKSPQLIIWTKSITTFVKSSQTNHRLITIYFILQVFSGRHGNNQINYYVQKKLSKTCRQFASLTVLLRGSIVSCNYKPKNSSNCLTIR